MFLDTLPVSYVIYTEEDLVKIIIGLELNEEHWDKVPAPELHFGLLPIFIGAHNSFDELMSVVPKEDITERVTTLIPTLSDYIEDPNDNTVKDLIIKYKELTNEQG